MLKDGRQSPDANHRPLVDALWKCGGPVHAEFLPSVPLRVAGAGAPIDRLALPPLLQREMGTWFSQGAVFLLTSSPCNITLALSGSLSFHVGIQAKPSNEKR